MMAMGAPALLTAVRFEIRNSSCNGVPPPPPPHNQNPPPLRSLLSRSKPSWIVRSESNVHRERRKKPDPPCVVCRGSGRVDCPNCHGKGRTNEVHLAMLPKGEWPKWCRTCGGTGLSYCSRCDGTGEYRYIMGFHFMKREDKKHYPVRNNQETQSVADLILNGEQSD